MNGTETPKGDLSEMIWNIAEIISKLSLQVELGAGDVILTGTPAGVAALQPRRQGRMRRRWHRHLEFEITKPK